MPVQLDVKRAAFFCVGHLVRRSQLVSRRVGGQAVGQQRLVAGEELAVRDVEIIIAADAVILQRIQAAAKLSLDHNRMQPRGAELAVEVGELRRAHGLVQYLTDDLLLGHSEQRRIFPGGRRRADGLEEDRQQLLLARQRKNGRPIHAFGGQTPAGGGSFGDMKELCFGGGQGHVGNPFFVFFDGVGDKQRDGPNKRAQRVADHIVRLRHAEGVAVLGILDPCAEDTAYERRESDSTPTMPLPRQRIGQHQPQREKEKDVHQHLPVKLRLLPGGGKRGKGREDQTGAAFRAGEDRCIKYGRGHQDRQNEVAAPPVPRSHICG